MKIKLYKQKNDYIERVNNSYVISAKEGSEPTVKVLNNGICLPINNKIYILDLEHAYNLSYLNPRFPNGYEDEFINIEFFKQKHHNIFRFVPIFKKQIEIIPGYRLIPYNPMFAISKEGHVLDLKTNRCIEHFHVNRICYPLVNIGKSYTVHRLVAICWVENPNPLKDTIVDHIDGDKNNYHYTNLRWCTSSKNVIYAMENNLKQDNKPVVIRNIETNKVTEHISLTAACAYMKRGRINTTHEPLENKLYWKSKTGVYEIKFKGDPRPWNYSLDINNLPYNTGKVIPVQAKNLQDGKVYTEKSMDDMSLFLQDNNLLKISSETIRKYILLQKSYNGWLFRKKPEVGDAKWVNKGSNLDYSSRPMSIRIIDIIDNTIHDFNSLRSASKFLRIDKDSVKRKLNENKIHANRYKITAPSLQ